MSIKCSAADSNEALDPQIAKQINQFTDNAPNSCTEFFKLFINCVYVIVSHVRWDVLMRHCVTGMLLLHTVPLVQDDRYYSTWVLITVTAVHIKYLFFLILIRRALIVKGRPFTKRHLRGLVMRLVVKYQDSYFKIHTQ